MPQLPSNRGIFVNGGLYMSEREVGEHGDGGSVHESPYSRMPMPSGQSEPDYSQPFHTSGW